MFSLQEALSITNKLVETFSSDIRLKVIDDYYDIELFGWIFYYSSEAYYHSRLEEDTIIGSCLIFFNRFTGQTEQVAYSNCARKKMDYNNQYSEKGVVVFE